MRDREERGVIKSKRTKTAPHSRVHDMYEEYCCTQVDQSSVGNPELKIAATYKQLPNPSASGYLATGAKPGTEKRRQATPCRLVVEPAGASVRSCPHRLQTDRKLMFSSRQWDRFITIHRVHVSCQSQPSGAPPLISY